MNATIQPIQYTCCRGGDGGRSIIGSECIYLSPTRCGDSGVGWDHGIVGVCGGVGRERGRLFLSRLSDVT